MIISSDGLRTAVPVNVFERTFVPTLASGMVLVVVVLGTERLGWLSVWRGTEAYRV